LGQVPIGVDRVPRYCDEAEKSIAEELNLSFIHEIVQWMEPALGRYIWTLMDRSINPYEDTFLLNLKELKGQGYVVQATFTNVNMDHKHLPAYLRNARFDDPYLLERWERYLEEFLSRYGDLVDFIELGNEVNIYFGQHRDEWSGYVEYVKTGARVIRRGKPSVRVGVTLALSGDRLEPYWRDVEPYCDHLSITYYVPCSIFEKSPVEEALDPGGEKYFARTLDYVVHVAGEKKILIQEVGCATDPVLDSSPELQARFIREFFHWVRERENRVLAVSWLSLVDWNYEETRRALKGVLDQRLLDHEPFMRYLTSLGLMYEDRRKKPGYFAFKEAATGLR